MLGDLPRAPNLPHCVASVPTRPEMAGRPPPAHWTPRRQELATAALHFAGEEIAKQLASTPRAWRSEGRRHVVLWDSVEWSVREDGTQFHCKPTHGYGDFFYPSANLRRPVSSGRWPLAFGGVLSKSCRAAGLDPRVLPGPTGDWIRSRLRATLRGAVEWNALRRDLLRWLALDPLTLALHSRIFVECDPGIETFNWVHRHGRHLAILAIERPRLLPFLSLVPREEGRPLAALQRCLHEAGVTTKAFAWMENVGFEAFGDVLRSGPLEPWAPLVARYANLLERLRIESPSPYLAELVAQERKLLPDWFYRSMQRVTAMLLDEGLTPEEACPPDLPEIVRWIRETRPQPDANQRCAGWVWLQEQARARCDLEAARQIEPWPCPYAVFSHEGLDIVPITSVPALREEALALRNCLETYAYECVTGGMQPFSVREPGSGARLACFMLVREGALGRWAVLQVAGPGNGEPPPAAVTAAEIARTQCNRLDIEACRARNRAAQARLDAADRE